MNELTSPLIEVKILPIIFCFHYPEKEKGQNRSFVLNLIQPNIEFVSNLTNDHEPIDHPNLVIVDDEYQRL